MPVIEYIDSRYEKPSPALDVSASDNYGHLARLVIDRRGPEVLEFADAIGINLRDELVRWNVLVSVRNERLRKVKEYNRLSSEANYKL